MLGNPEYTLEQQTEWVWKKVNERFPKFKPSYCLSNDPHMIDGLVAENCHRFCGFPDARVMDIGANQGVWSAFCAAHGADVTAYEPFIGSYSVMEKMIQANGFSENIHPINKAVWVYTGQCSFIGAGGHIQNAPWTTYNGSLQIEGVLAPASPRESTHGKFRGNTSGIPDAPKVDCVSLADAIGQSEWDCVKMDIEGAEFQLLLSTPNAVLQNINFLTVEFHSGWADLELYQSLMSKLSEVFTFDGVKDGDPQFVGEDRYQCLWATRKSKAGQTNNA